MKSLRNQAKSEEGSVLVISLIMLSLLTLIGIMGMTNTETEILIARNEMFHKIAFFTADAGVYATPKLISSSLDGGAEQTVTDMTYLGDTGTFYREIMGFDSHDSDNDVQFTLVSHDVAVDVNRTREEPLPGGGVEFASGSEGLGVGATGGVAIYYEMDSFGDGPASSASNVGACYRKVVGVPGGL